MKRTFVALLLFSWMLNACTKAMPPATNTETTPRPVVAGPRVVLPDGFVVSIEIADDEELRAQGLMYRDHLAADAGMLFFFAQEDEYPFWMKNTRIPLDIIWIDSNRHIAHVKNEVPPCRVPDCPSYPPNAKAKYVLELAGGEAVKHGLKAGDLLRFEGTENVVAR
jgi:uncharacterized membrane protein (UPF0127 family)